MRVLVIEDQPIEMKLAVHVLDAAGHTVVRAGTADEAQDAIKTTAPEVILLDLGLPGMNGLELARNLKADPATRAIPIVAVTSYPELFPRRAALASGCDAYFIKPVSTRKLPGVLSEAVVRAGGAEAP